MEENGVPAGAGRRVRQIMTTSVVKIQPSTPVSEIARLMVEHQVSGLPVVDPDNRVLGVVTEIDMVARNQRFKLPAFITFLDSIIYLETPGHFRKRLEHMLGASARDIMSEPAVTIAADASIEELAELMVDREINPVPVVEAGRLVGIVSRSDIIRLMVEGAAGAG